VNRIGKCRPGAGENDHREHRQHYNPRTLHTLPTLAIRGIIYPVHFGMFGSLEQCALMRHESQTLTLRSDLPV
jgi:hypothetical protein